ncbi:hypothetical protein [Sulfurimonas sp.]|uniref:hypothetical protein n=1 Tax=Sulfurimonas sp. TaxID=2022749 RepID=UPI003565EE1C
MNAKKWIKIWIIILIIIPMVGGFNYLTDSLGILNDKGYLDKAAKDLASGNMIAGLKNFDERLFKKKVIENIKDDIDWIAIGSSRTMQLRKRTFLKQNEKFHNYSVSGASLEDFIALVSIHIDNQGKLPKHIVLGIDPWIFNKYSGQNGYLSIVDDYNKLISNINNKQNIDLKPQYINKLFSIEYLIENFKFFMDNVNNKLKGYYIVNSIEIDARITELDGSIQYPYKYRRPSNIIVEEAAIKYTKGRVYALDRFTKLNNLELFKEFVLYLKDGGVDVVFFLPPYNPISYDLLLDNEKYLIINKVEKYLFDFAKKYNIKLFGSYNPHKYKLTSKDFFDGMHGKDIVYTRIFKNKSINKEH